MHSFEIKGNPENIKADLKWEALFLKHKENEAERNRQCKLKIAEIYTKAMACQPVNSQPSAPSVRTSCSIKLFYTFYKLTVTNKTV